MKKMLLMMEINHLPRGEGLPIYDYLPKCPHDIRPNDRNESTSILGVVCNAYSRIGDRVTPPKFQQWVETVVQSAVSVQIMSFSIENSTALIFGNAATANAKSRV